MNPLFGAHLPTGRTLLTLDRALDLRAQRQAIIHGNLANVETPGYQSKDIRFADTMATASGTRSSLPLVTTHARHLGPKSRGHEPAPRPQWEEEAPVDVVLEMNRLNENAGGYGSTAALMRGRLDALLMAARGRR